MYCIWLDDARQREQLALAHASWAVAAAKAGAKPHQIGDWTDPADLMDEAGDPATGRDRDPAGRAAQIRAFLAASGMAGDATPTSSGPQDGG